MTPRLLIVEDDAALNQMLALHFEDEGLAVDGVGTCAEARERVAAGAFDLILLDQQLPDGTGLALLPDLLTCLPAVAVVMMTGRHDLELAIEAISLGAADFLHKPVTSAELQGVVERLLAQGRLARGLEPEIEDSAPELGRILIGRSAAMLAVSKEIALSARSGANVLVTGESGTGKEVVARLLHQHSGRLGPFVAVNCAAIVDTLLESELFGHEKGAFTGAQGRKLGKLEQAQDGTLFLDEVGELAQGLQAKLLRALQERVFERVGGTETIATNARVVAATHRDLLADARAGRFREDLLYRLDVLRIRVPALRERKDDIPLLTAALLRRIAESLECPVPHLAPGCLSRLEAHDWPGNVRELENVLTQAALHAHAGVITQDLLTFGKQGASVPKADRGPDLRTLSQVEAEHVQGVLDHTGGHKGRACEILGISRPALDRKIERHGLRVPGR
jgi:DNA-binding NtrC family response regulator